MPSSPPEPSLPATSGPVGCTGRLVLYTRDGNFLRCTGCRSTWEIADFDIAFEAVNRQIRCAQMPTGELKQSAVDNDQDGE